MFPQLLEGEIMKKVVNDLISHLKLDPGIKAQLATKLGYRTTATIDRWIAKKKIPDWQLQSVETFLKKKGK